MKYRRSHRRSSRSRCRPEPAAAAVYMAPAVRQRLPPVPLIPTQAALRFREIAFSFEPPGSFFRSCISYQERGWLSVTFEPQCIFIGKKTDLSFSRRSFPPSRRVRFAPRADIRPNPAFMSTRPSPTLAELLMPLPAANPFSTMRASLRWYSSEELEDGVTYGGQSWLRRGSVDSFFSALLLRDGDAAGRRKRSSS